MKTQNKHIVFDYTEAPEYKLLCLICKDFQPIKLPLEIDELSRIGKLFTKKHKNCKG